MLRLGAIGLLILVLSGTALNHVYFNVRRTQIHTEIKQQIKKNIPIEDLHVIRFSENDTPQWMKDQKEFKFQGHLYDIVRSTEADNGDKVYYCIDDIQEKSLFAFLENDVNNLLGNPDNSLGSSLNSSNHAYTPIQLINPVFSISSLTESKSVFHYCFSVNTNDGTTEVPPPNFC